MKPVECESSKFSREPWCCQDSERVGKSITVCEYYISCLMCVSVCIMFDCYSHNFVKQIFPSLTRPLLEITQARRNKKLCFYSSGWMMRHNTFFYLNKLKVLQMVCSVLHICRSTCGTRRFRDLALVSAVTIQEWEK